MRLVNFDAIKVAQLDLSLVDQGIKLIAKGIYINTKTGQSYGQATNTNWSRETITKLRELLAAMEAEMEAIYFAETSETTETGMSEKLDFKGISERLGEDEGAQQG